MKRNIFKKFGNTLLKKGRWFCSYAFQVKLEEVNAKIVENLVISRTGLEKHRVWQADNHYYWTDLKTVKDILKYDLIDQEEYKDKGRRDCDKFATAIYHRFRWIYGINTMALARWMYVYENDKYLYSHRANVFATNDSKVYFLEPQTDQLIELTGSKEIYRGGKCYTLNVIDF